MAQYNSPNRRLWSAEERGPFYDVRDNLQSKIYNL
jgi:hypothetical protein